MKIDKKRYQCPVCRSPLSRERYLRALGLWQEHRRHLRRLREEAQKLRAEKKELEQQWQQRLQEERKRWERKIEEEARRQARTLLREAKKRERERREQQLQRLQEKIQRLREENRRLRIALPQEQGLIEEKKLFEALRAWFPEDRITHTGKGGDIVHEVCRDGAVIGRIVYECKDTREFKQDYIRQTMEAKRQRKADFAVLVSRTMPRRQSFIVESEVIVVQPHSVQIVVILLRDMLIRMAILQMHGQRREEALTRLYEYLQSPDFRNLAQHVDRRMRNLWRMLGDEMKSHIRIWKERKEAYWQIHEDINQMLGRIESILIGDLHPSRRAFPPLSREELPTLPGV